MNALILPQIRHLYGIEYFHKELSRNNEEHSLLEGNSLTNELQPKITKPIQGPAQNQPMMTSNL